MNFIFSASTCLFFSLFLEIVKEEWMALVCRITDSKPQLSEE